MKRKSVDRENDQQGNCKQENNQQEIRETETKCIWQKRCVIGEGPIWNEKEQRLYFVNGLNDEICSLDIESGELIVRERIYAVCWRKKDESNDNGYQAVCGA